MRLIDADALKEKAALRHGYDFQGVFVKVQDIDAMPTVKTHGATHMRVQITTDDFHDPEYAKANGCYRKHYFCPSCDIEIGHKTFDSKRKFGQGTVLHSNEFPNFCPSCGADLRERKGDDG